MIQDFQPLDLIDRGTIIYGPSNSGKTTLLIDLLFQLKNQIPLCYIISGSEDIKPVYSNYIHNRLICKDVEKIGPIIDQIMLLQKKSTKIYNRVNKVKTLKNICNYLSVQQKEQINLLLPDEIEEETARLIYKKFISENREELLQQDISEKYKTYINNLNLNPKILIIFDDCMANGVKIINQKLVEIFFQGRHSHITSFLATQQDTRVNKELRNNAHYSIFCTPDIGYSVIKKQYDTQQAREIQEKITTIFTTSNINSINSINSISNQKEIKAIKAIATNTGDLFKYKVSLYDQFAFGCNEIIKFYKQLNEIDQQKDEEQ